MNLQTAKAWLKGRFKQARIGSLRTFRSFDAAALQRALHAVGIEAGDVVFVHSAYDAFAGFTGKPSEVIAALEEAVGADGTVMMPSLPFTGSALDYVAAGHVTDIRRTPSQMGLLTELFRRQKGTLRSLHPTHPVLAKGPLAERLIAGHERAATPCGAGSPFARLPEAGAKLLFLGTSIEAMTFFHYLEEAYEDRLPTCPFTTGTVTATVRDGDRIETITLRLFDRALSRKRRISRLLPGLNRRRAVRAVKVGALDITAVAARDVEDVFRDMAERGEALYDD